MQARLGRGDVVGNLAICGLVLNAYLATGESRYADWIVAYVEAWEARAQANGGIVPDNVGLDGVVGSQLEGRWYGGHYGWALAPTASTASARPCSSAPFAAAIGQR